jgi:hypothetical protein
LVLLCNPLHIYACLQQHLHFPLAASVGAPAPLEAVGQGLCRLLTHIPAANNTRPLFGSSSPINIHSAAFLYFVPAEGVPRWVWSLAAAPGLCPTCEQCARFGRAWAVCETNCSDAHAQMSLPPLHCALQVFVRLKECLWGAYHDWAPRPPLCRLLAAVELAVAYTGHHPCLTLQDRVKPRCRFCSDPL